MKMNKVKKSQKPTDYDISFKYICNDCGNEHWLFLREVKTKGFKIVCDCSQIIEPDVIKDIDIIYDDTEEEVIIEQSGISDKTMYSCCKTLSDFGYSETESKNMVMQSFDALQVEEPTRIIEYAIRNFGE